MAIRLTSVYTAAEPMYEGGEPNLRAGLGQAAPQCTTNRAYLYHNQLRVTESAEQMTSGTEGRRYFSLLRITRRDELSMIPITVGDGCQGICQTPTDLWRIHPLPPQSMFTSLDGQPSCYGCCSL